MLTAALLAFTIAAAVAQASRQPHDQRSSRAIPVSAGGPRTEGRPNTSDQARTVRLDSYWHRRFLIMRHVAYLRARRIREIRRVLFTRPSITEAINLACAVYGNCATLWALARCESGLSPTAQNHSGSSGLLQFMPGTFRSTPFGRFSIWSPYANALAGGWMLRQGRRSEWVC